MDVLKRLLDGGFIVWRVGGELKIRHDSRPMPPELAAQIKGHKSEILATLKRGEELLFALWAAGYWVWLERRSDGAGFFLLPRGRSKLPPRELEELFALYEENHDDALLTLLLGLPVKPDGTRDADWWNRASEALQSGRLRLTIALGDPEAEAKPTSVAQVAVPSGGRKHRVSQKAEF